MDPTPTVVTAQRCRCGHLKLKMGGDYVHIAPGDEPDAREKITRAHNDLGRFDPPPDPRATSAYPQH